MLDESYAYSLEFPVNRFCSKILPHQFVVVVTQMQSLNEISYWTFISIKVCISLWNVLYEISRALRNPKLHYE